jgi:PAS domain-containing protein
VDYARNVADAILSTAADAVIASDSEGIIRVWNPGAERVLPSSPSGTRAHHSEGAHHGWAFNHTA